MKFSEWLKTDELTRLYAKADIAVKIVNMYNPKLLENISTIANLSSGAYGVYNSGDNKKLLPQNTEQALIYYGKVARHNLDMIPKKTLLQYYPNLKPTDIKETDTIHVNVRRIMLEAGSDLEAVLEIASTILHECTHEIERETLGQTSEAGPVNAERVFMSWAKANMNKLMAMFPQLQGDIVGPKGQLGGPVISRN